MSEKVINLFKNKNEQAKKHGLVYNLFALIFVMCFSIMAAVTFVIAVSFIYIFVVIALPFWLPYKSIAIYLRNNAK